MIFKANYFNGTSSKTYVTTINTNPNGWHITFINDFERPEEISWNIHKIKRSEVYTKGLVSFSYGETFPFQKIESSDVNFIDYISKSEHQNINNKVDTFLHKSIKKSILLLVALILTIASGLYFFVIPTVAETFAKNLPKQSVINFGDYVFNLLSHNLDINDKQSEKLQDLVDALEINSEFPIKVYVAESDQLNAFAVSGGKFVIYSGLLEELKTEHQLTALIGHEVSHFENRHALKSVARNLSGALFISIVFGDVNAVSSIIGENAHLFSQLSFSRSLEKEADIFGLEIMRNNNLDLNGMPELFEILNEKNNIDVPSFLNSHPMLDDRIGYTKEIADAQDDFETNTIIKEKWLLLKNSMDIYEEDNLIEETNE